MELRKISQNKILLIDTHHASFLTSLYTDQYSSLPPEVRIQTSLLIASLVSHNMSTITFFEKTGLISIVYPLFPYFKIPSFLYFFIQNSDQCCEYLINQGFAKKLIFLLSSIQMNETEEITPDEKEHRSNFLNYLLCAGSICDIDRNESELLQFGPIFNSIILRENDWAIQCEAISSLSILIKKKEAASFFLKEESILEIISPTRCESNIFYLMSVSNLIGSLLQHQDILSEPLINMFLEFLAKSLNIIKCKCGENASFESCACSIANSISEGCSEANPLFPLKCLECGLIAILFEIFNGNNPWNLKLNIFETILRLFSYGIQNIHFFNTLTELGFFDLFLDNLAEMCADNSFAITLALSAMIKITRNSDNDDYEALKEILFSEQVADLLDNLADSQDPEIKYDVERIQSFIKCND